MHGSSAGLLTTAGFEKPQYYYRAGLWSEKPFVALVTAPVSQEGQEPWDYARSWNYIPGDIVEIRCYSTCGAPTVTLNGHRLELECRVEENGSYSCVAPFEEGELVAHAGEATDSLETTGAAAAIRLEAVDKLIAGSAELCQIELTLTDVQGRRVCGASNRLTVTVEGGAELAALDNGDLFDTTDCHSATRRAFRGQMMIYLRAKDVPGKAVVTVEGEGLKKAKITVPKE